MPVKFGQTSIKFWFFLSYLITTVQAKHKVLQKFFRLSICIDFSVCIFLRLLENRYVTIQHKEHRKKHENVCVPCGKTYKHHNDKIVHDQSVHQDPSLRTCIRCDRLYANAAELYKHHQKEHPGTRLVRNFEALLRHF